MALAAQSRIQDDVHPLLRHPKPIKRDSAKAQRMLGLIADDEEKLKALQREKSITTRWLERPMYEHLEVSDMESERDEMAQEQKTDSVHEGYREEDDAALLERWAKPDRPLSYNSEASIHIEPKTKLDTSFISRRPDPITCPRPVSYNAQHMLSPEWTASPTAISPTIQRRRPMSQQHDIPNAGRGSYFPTSSAGSSPRFLHPEAWCASRTQDRANARGARPISLQPQTSAPFGSPIANEPRPRPTSFATYPHQRNRVNTKIASSRGLRNNSYPNFSRPTSEIAPKAVPGEHMENDDGLYQQLDDDEFRPPSPSSPVCATLDGFNLSEEKKKPEKKPKKRWSTIPQTFRKLARRSSAAEQEPPKFEVKIDDLRHTNLTEENLHWYDHEIKEAPVTPKSGVLGIDLIPTPTYSPLDMEHPLFESHLPLPFAPWAGSPPSPASSADKLRGSGTSSPSPPRKTAPSRLSVENVVQNRPASLRSHRSSFVVPSPASTAPQQRHAIDVPVSPRTTPSQRNTPTLDRTCIICKTTRPPSEFVNRRMTINCWHDNATCLHCIQSWIESCLNTQNLGQCTCLECGENMTYEDVGAFTGDAPFMG